MMPMMAAVPAIKMLSLETDRKRPPSCWLEASVSLSDIVHPFLVHDPLPLMSRGFSSERCDRIPPPTLSYLSYRRSSTHASSAERRRFLTAKPSQGSERCLDPHNILSVLVASKRGSVHHPGFRSQRG